MTTLYYANIHNFPTLKGYDLLPLERQEKVTRYHRQADKIRCLVAGLLLLHCLGAENCDKITYIENGKPYLEGSSLFFNLSHSGDYVVLGISDSEIGVDVEQISDYSPKVARKCFTDEEQDWLETMNSNHAFFQLWTAKESIMKVTGRGFLLPPESFHVLPVEDCFHLINEKNWYLQWYDLLGHAVCVATEDSSSLDIKEFTPSDLFL